MFALSCGHSDLQWASAERSPQPSANKSSTTDDSFQNTIDVNVLCSRLSELQRIPFEKGAKADDPVYDGLMSYGQDAIPCLIKEISNTAPAIDPRESPHVRDYVIGDSAVFLLSRITGEPIVEMLPKNIADQWADRGIYAYFDFVSRLENRKTIQKWWEKWFEDYQHRKTFRD